MPESPPKFRDVEEEREVGQYGGLDCWKGERRPLLLLGRDVVRTSNDDGAVNACVVAVSAAATATTNKEAIGILLVMLGDILPFMVHQILHMMMMCTERRLPWFMVGHTKVTNTGFF